MIYYFDCDMHGTRSIDDLLGAGGITHLKCPTFKAFQDHVITTIRGGLGANDLCIIDTFSKLLDRTRQEGKLGTKLEDDLFARGVTKYLEGDKNFLNVYNFAQGLDMRRIDDLRSTDSRLYLLCGETERVDETLKANRLMPTVNPALVDPLTHASDSVFRLIQTTEDKVVKGVTHKRGTRVLYLRDDEDFIAKYNVPLGASDAVPKYLVNPVMATIEETLGDKPVFMLLYGRPGSGKTTLACSEARTTK